MDSHFTVGPGTMEARRFLLAILAFVVLAAGFVSIVPQAQGGSITDTNGVRRFQEDFESFTASSAPDDTWYDVSSSGSGFNLVAGSSPIATGKAWQIIDTGAAYAAQIQNTKSGVSLCSASQTFSFTSALPDLADTATWELRATASTLATTAAPANSLGVRATGTATADNNLAVFVRGNAGAAQVSTTLGAVAANVAFTVTISQGTCTGTPNWLFVVTSGGNQWVKGQSGAAADAFSGTINKFSVACTSLCAGQNAYVDTYDWNGAPIVADSDEERIITSQANSGLRPSVVRLGNAIFVAHALSSGAVILTKSTDNGATWTDIATGINQGTSARLKIVAQDANKLVILAGEFLYWSSNGGTSWSAGLDLHVTDACTDTPGYGGGIKRADVLVVGTTVFYTLFQKTNNGPHQSTMFLKQTTNFFSSSSDLTSVQGTAGGSCPDMRNPTDPALLPNAAGTSACWIYRIHGTGSPITNCGWTFNDPVTPLSNYGRDILMDSTGKFATFRTDAATWYQAVYSQATSQWFFRSLGATSALGSAWPSPYDTTAAHLLLVSPTSATVYAQLQKSTGNSDAPTVVTMTYGTGDPNNFAGAIAADCAGSKLFLTYPSQSASKLALRDPTYSCTVGGGAGGITSAATATVTNLVGFDVDPTGQTAIARTEAGDKVVTWAAQGLGSPGATFDTNCDNSHRDGVTAGSENVVFLDCNGDDSLAIRDILLGDPSVPQGCSDAPADFNSWNANGIDEALVSEISNLGYFSVDWEVHDDGTCAAYAVLVAGTTDGRIGMITGVFSTTEALSDKTPVFKQYTASSVPVYVLCGQAFDDPQVAGSATNLFVVAVDANSATVAYRWNTDLYNPTLSSYAVLSGALGSMDALDCTSTTDAARQGFIALGNGNGVYGVSLITGTQSWARTDIVPETDGVAVSLDGKWVAVSDDAGTSHVLNATTGATVATITTPTGTFKGIRLDSTGQNLWIATSTTIARFEITEHTTGTPVQTCILCSVQTSATQTGTGDTDVFHPAGATLPPGFETQVMYDFFLGLLMTFSVGAGGFFTFKKSVIALAIFGILGFLAAFAFGLFQTWMLLVAIVLAVLLIFLKIRGSMSSGQ